MLRIVPADYVLRELGGSVQAGANRPDRLVGHDNSRKLVEIDAVKRGPDLRFHMGSSTVRLIDLVAFADRDDRLEAVLDQELRLEVDVFIGFAPGTGVPRNDR